MYVKSINIIWNIRIVYDVNVKKHPKHLLKKILNLIKRDIISQVNFLESIMVEKG